MPMYIPPHYKINELPTIHAMMRAVRLATLVTSGPDGMIGTPVLLLLAEKEGDYGTLYGHVAKSNPQWRVTVTGDALAIFSGPNAYVTPSWYASKVEHGRVVPTWNFLAVHAYGPVEFFEDSTRLLDVVTRLTNLHEGTRDEPWQVSDAPEAYIAGQLRGIVGLRIPITRIEGKSKMSQNRNAADRAGIVAGLSASDSAADRHVATLIPQSERGDRHV
jgi:transcriptional regulator